MNPISSSENTAGSAATAVKQSSIPLILSCISFFGLGMLTAALGPALGDLSTRTGTTLAAMGSVFTGLFLGAIISQAFAGSAQDRFGPRPVLLSGLALLGLGTIGLTLAPSVTLVFILSVVSGLGHGAVDVTTNVMVGELYHHRRAAVINLVNVFFGIGAFLGPAIAGVTLRAWDTALPSLWLGGGLILLLILPMAIWAPALPAHTGESSQPGRKAVSVYRTPLLWLMGALILVYVGIENGTGGWTPTYLERTTGLLAADAALVTSGFWLAITAGRVVATVLGTRLSSSRLLVGSLVISLAGAALFALGRGSATISTLGIVIMGIGFGPIFPTTIAIVTATFRSSAGAAAGIVVALGGLGGMIMPWGQGLMLEYIGPVASQALTVAATAAMLGLFVVISREINRRSKLEG